MKRLIFIFLALVAFFTSSFAETVNIQDDRNFSSPSNRYYGARYPETGRNPSGNFFQNDPSSTGGYQSPYVNALPQDNVSLIQPRFTEQKQPAPYYSGEYAKAPLPYSKLEATYNKRIYDITNQLTIENQKKGSFKNLDNNYTIRQMDQIPYQMDHAAYQMDQIAKDVKVFQFGYDFFNKIITTDYLLPVGDTYTLGPGDTLSLYLWGDPIEISGLNGFYSLEIDRSGKVFIPTVGAIYVWGMNVGEVKTTLKKFFSKKFKNFELELTLGKIRNFPVYVTGEVGKQGILFVNGTNSILDALTLAGGVTKNGSLRDIVLKRYVDGKLEEFYIDLYDILIFGNPINMQIKEGDSIFVKPIGKTVAIFGDVKRQGIFEIKDNETISSLVNFFGGFLPTANTDIVRLYKLNKKQEIINIKSQNEQLADGDILNIQPLNMIIENNIVVLGHIKYPGQYAIEEYNTLSKILKKVELLPDTDIKYGEIYRINPATNIDELFTFTPSEVLEGGKDILLQPMDKITFYKMRNFDPITLSGEIETPSVITYYDGITLTDALRRAKFKFKIDELRVDIFTSDMQLRSIYLQDLLIKGIKELDVLLPPGTQLVVKKTFDLEKEKVVTILGEVAKPGTYKLIQGMTLYDLIVQAGGYTDYAYSKAMVFIRESAKRQQYEQLQLTLITMEEAISKNTQAYAGAGGSEQEKALLDITLNKQKRSFELLKRKAEMGLGRIALEIPEKLEELKDSDQNIELVDGDSIYIPLRPSYVLVLGSVYNQLSLPYKRDYSVKDYLEDVGGLSKNADKTDIYVIKSSGKIVSQRNFSSKYLGWDNGKFYFRRDFMAMNLEQGDAIVIPEEIKVPILWMPLIRDVTSILFQAISTVAIVNNL